MIKVGYVTNKKELKIGDVFYSERDKDYMIVTDINLNAVTFQVLGDPSIGTKAILSTINIEKLKLIYDSHINLDEVPICDHCNLYCFYNYRYYNNYYCGENHLHKNISEDDYIKGFNKDPNKVYYTEYIFY